MTIQKQLSGNGAKDVVGRYLSQSRKAAPPIDSNLIIKSFENLV
jgi:hypothetical protein